MYCSLFSYDIKREINREKKHSKHRTHLKKRFNGASEMYRINEYNAVPYFSIHLLNYYYCNYDDD